MSAPPVAPNADADTSMTLDAPVTPAGEAASEPPITNGDSTIKVKKEDKDKKRKSKHEGETAEERAERKKRKKEKKEGEGAEEERRWEEGGK